MTKSQNDQQAVKSNASTFVCLFFLSAIPPILRSANSLCFYDGWCSYVEGLWLIFVRSAKSNKLTSREGNFPDIKTDWMQLQSWVRKCGVCTADWSKFVRAAALSDCFNNEPFCASTFNPPCSKNFCLLNCNYDKLCTLTVFNCKLRSSLFIAAVNNS